MNKIKILVLCLLISFTTGLYTNSNVSFADEELPNYCNSNGCYEYVCNAPGDCNWVETTYTDSSRTCTEVGCYVFRCSGSGASRSCSWVEDDKPFFRDYTQIQ